MTEKESSNIEVVRKYLLARNNYRCEVCNAPINELNCQLAHRIISSKNNLKKYGKVIIHHYLNLATVCSLYCNAKVNIENKPEIKKDLLKKIMKKVYTESNNSQDIIMK